jgi:hypothetical protein
MRLIQAGDRQHVLPTLPVFEINETVSEHDRPIETRATPEVRYVSRTCREKDC